MEIRPVEETDIQVILTIYNSNRDFLIHHIGRDDVDEEFILHEINEMREHGFSSNLIYDEDNPIGVIDYMLQPSGYVYLSLLMIDKHLHNKGIGRKVYKFFEQKILSEGAKIIRIDVVNDYTPNVIPFWEQMGFSESGTDALTWGDKTSNVLIMKKQEFA